MNATPKAAGNSTVSEILARTEVLENEKAEAIVSLLAEADELDTSTVRRQAEIKDQLKALGYKVARPRKPK